MAAAWPASAASPTHTPPLPPPPPPPPPPPYPPHSRSGPNIRHTVITFEKFRHPPTPHPQPHICSHPHCSHPHSNPNPQPNQAGAAAGAQQLAQFRGRPQPTAVCPEPRACQLISLWRGRAATGQPTPARRLSLRAERRGMSARRTAAPHGERVVLVVPRRLAALARWG